MNNRDRLILLHHCRGIGRRTIMKILKDDPYLEQLHKLTYYKLTHDYQMKKNLAEIFLHDLRHLDMTHLINSYIINNIHILTIYDEKFPLKLAEISDPPLVLFYMGNLHLLTNEKLLSVVGTRSPTQDCLRILQHVLQPLIKEGWTIVSGLAVGVDTMAHELGLKQATIAVLGSGFNHIYPQSNLPIFREISTNHLVLSEYPPYQRPQKFQFPERNRIISGISWGTLVVEAKQRSGSLITADQALDQGREVFAIPGSILQKEFFGTNHLIQQGAKLVQTSEDILSEWKTIAKI